MAETTDDEWPTIRLGDVLERRTEIVHPKNGPSGPATFVGLEHIDKGTGIRLGSETIEKSEMTGRRAQFYAGDIVYGYLRPYLNKVWVAEFDGLCSVDQYVYTYDAERVDPEYVSAFMRSPVFLDRAPVGDSPGQLPRIRAGEVDAVKMILPPIDVQRQIATELQAHRVEVQNLQTALQEQIAAVEALPAAYLMAAFRGVEASRRRGVEASRWPVVRLSEIADLIPARSLSKRGDTEVIAATSACLTESGFSADGLKEALMDAAGAVHATLESGEVLVARSNTPALVGRASVYEGDPSGVVASDLLIRVRVGHRAEPAYVGYYLSHLYLSGYWAERAGGASGTMKKVRRTQVLAVEMILPPLDVQRWVVEGLRQRQADARALVDGLRAQESAARSLPGSLLQAAFEHPAVLVAA